MNKHTIFENIEGFLAFCIPVFFVISGFIYLFDLKDRYISLDSYCIATVSILGGILTLWSLIRLGRYFMRVNDAEGIDEKGIKIVNNARTYVRNNLSSNVSGLIDQYNSVLQKQLKNHLLIFVQIFVSAVVTTLMVIVWVTLGSTSKIIAARDPIEYFTALQIQVIITSIAVPEAGILFHYLSNFFMAIFNQGDGKIDESTNNKKRNFLTV